VVAVQRVAENPLGGVRIVLLARDDRFDQVPADGLLAGLPPFPLGHVHRGHVAGQHVGLLEQALDDGRGQFGVGGGLSQCPVQGGMPDPDAAQEPVQGDIAADGVTDHLDPVGRDLVEGWLSPDQDAQADQDRGLGRPPQGLERYQPDAALGHLVDDVPGHGLAGRDRPPNRPVAQQSPRVVDGGRVAARLRAAGAVQGPDPGEVHRPTSS
jgi:hypothetical protein